MNEFGTSKFTVVSTAVYLKKQLQLIDQEQRYKFKQLALFCVVSR